MASLTRDVRRQLERTVAEARNIAEEGAEQSLKRLAVDVSRPHDALTSEEKKFRVSLRAHAKQLGDRLDERSTRLIQAVAYEHWHRLLFARFLIENDLLLHPEHKVALSLDEMKEIALGQNREWVEVAADYAQSMLLRRVFQPEDPALRVSLPPEKRLQLEAKLNSLPREVFLADDSLGWVYQFWQKEAKETINKSEVEIGSAELAPVTQLFTEDYMVLFLLENTLGAWWTARHGKPDLPGYAWTYLRLNDDGTPSAGTFAGWPSTAKELRVLDPCMGSGHFLTFALPILARMRVAEEELPLSDAIVAVLCDNLFGLELDPRCSQIAAFNLALTAWRLAGVHFDIPQLNVACSGLGINAKEDDWARLAGADGRKQELMRWLYSLFSNAPTLGSLIDPRRIGRPLVELEIASLIPLLEQALTAEQSSEDTKELVIAARGLLAAAKILSDSFTLVATNVPFLGRSNQNDVLKRHCETFHADAKSDLATCFVDRCLRFCAPAGSIALVSKHEPLFLSDYKTLRPRLLKTVHWDFVARLGPRAFETITGEVVSVALMGLSLHKPVAEDTFLGLDATFQKTPVEKAKALREGPQLVTSQLDQLKNPDSIIVLGPALGTTFLSRYANAWQGIATSDLPRFERAFWELDSVTGGWHFQQSVPSITGEYLGRERILFWQDGTGVMTGVCQKGATFRGQSAWNGVGVVIGQMSSLPATLYTGEKFSNTVAVVVPYDPTQLLPIWAFCSSAEFAQELRRVNPKLNVDNGYISKVPFEVSRWSAVAAEKYPTGLPKPSASDPTQWLFEGIPKGSDDPLQVAVARLVGYRWPRQTGSSFPECPVIAPDGLEAYADSDGIVCLAPLTGEDSAAERLRVLLRASYAAEYNLAELLKDKKSSTLEDWVREEFFEEHCSAFHQRPFVWHVWDGRKDGFHALLNYHKLDHRTLEKLIYSSLGDWIGRQRQDVTSGIEGADGRLAAAEHLQNQLKKILEGESSEDKTRGYDVFVRWKPLNAQPIGWDPDLNDGVRMNIRPWITEARLYRASKPGILRVTPNIRYGKDRGKEPARDLKEFPWFKGNTDRNNDIHLSLDEKRRARGSA